VRNLILVSMGCPLPSPPVISCFPEQGSISQSAIPARLSTWGLGPNENSSHQNKEEWKRKGNGERMFPPRLSVSPWLILIDVLSLSLFP